MSSRTTTALFTTIISPPPIGSLVEVQSRHGFGHAYITLVVGHPDPRRPDHPVVEVLRAAR